MFRYIFVLLIIIVAYNCIASKSKESKTPHHEALASIQVNHPTNEACYCWEYYLKSDPINQRTLYQTCDSLQWIRVRQQVEVFDIVIPCPKKKE